MFLFFSRQILGKVRIIPAFCFVNQGQFVPKVNCHSVNWPIFVGIEKLNGVEIVSLHNK